jgi:hypothetical protein
VESCASRVPNLVVRADKRSTIEFANVGAAAPKEIDIDMHALRYMPMREVSALREAIHTLSMYSSSSFCQSRFCWYAPNEAGDVLESLAEWTILGFETDMADDYGLLPL